MTPQDPNATSGVNEPAAAPQAAVDGGQTSQVASSQTGPAQAGSAAALVRRGSGANSARLPAVSASSTTLQQSESTVDSPLAAADDEVIEQEWVQKAKQIVSQTKDDPYSQESQIGKLQADYIKKRYGREVKLSGE